MDHSRNVTWDPGIADSLTILVCHDCLCLMALFRTVMYLAHYLTRRIAYTGPDEGSGRNRAWMEQYLSGLCPPCVVDWLSNDATEIKAFDRFFVIHVDGNNSDPRCVCVRGVPLKMFSAGRTSLRLTGCSGRGGGPVDCSDWLRVDCAVYFSAGEVWSGYIRKRLWTDSLINAAPVTGSLLDSALSDCLIERCTAGFYSKRTFRGTDFVLLAGLVLSVRRVNDIVNMAADGAALVEARAGVTFGVELYVVPAGESSSVGTANHVGPDGPVVAGSPIGPCETLSPLFHDALGTLEHSVPDETILGLDPLEHSGLDHAETILSRVEELLSSLDVAGRLRPVVAAGKSSSVGTANPVGSDGPVVTGSPIGLCETLSPLFHDVLGREHSVPDETILGLDPLEHSGLDHAETILGLDLLEYSGLDDAGPVGRHVAGGPVGPDEMLLGLNPLEYSGLYRADPAGQHAAVGPVGLFGTMSPSDCYPAGPAGPYVAGGPVGPDEKFQVLDPLEHSSPDHADPAGQHAIFQDVLEPLEHSVLDTALDGRPMSGFPVLGPIEHSVLEITPDGGHSEMTIDDENR